MEETGNACWIMVEILKEIDHGRPRHKWAGNTKRNLTEIGWVRMNWILLAQNRDQWMASGSIKCWQYFECLLK
jgi:hypothetical protein